jgi:catechol 2,3-dioxygenase-like lactoylglutathione lyase family enzyme
MSGKLKLSQLRLLVDDFQACKAFYRDVMGLEMTLETEGEVYAQFIDGEVSLGLYARELMASVVGTEDAGGQRAAKDTALVVFEVENVDAAVKAMRARGAEFLSEPQDQEAWFMRVAHLRDPDGNLIEIFHSLYVGE